MTGLRLPVLLVIALLSACSTAPVEPGGERSPAAINAELGLNYLQKGDYDMALVKLKKSLEEEPRRGETHHYLAELYRRTGDSRRAEQEFETAVRLQPNDALIWHNYAVFLCAAGRYGQAQQAFDRAIANDHGLRRSLLPEQAGLCALQADDAELAERRFRAALEKDPQAANPLYQLARLMVRKQDYMRARAFVERLMAVHADNRLVLELAIEIESALGDQEAVADYRRRLQALGDTGTKQGAGRDAASEKGDGGRKR